MNIIEEIEKQQLRDDIPEFSPGDTVAVQVRIKEGSRAVSYTHLTLPTKA